MSLARMIPLASMTKTEGISLTLQRWRFSPFSWGSHQQCQVISPFLMDFRRVSLSVSMLTFNSEGPAFHPLDEGSFAWVIPVRVPASGEGQNHDLATVVTELHRFAVDVRPFSLGCRFADCQVVELEDLSAGRLTRRLAAYRDVTVLFGQPGIDLHGLGFDGFRYSRPGVLERLGAAPLANSSQN